MAEENSEKHPIFRCLCCGATNDLDEHTCTTTPKTIGSRLENFDKENKRLKRELAEALEKLKIAGGKTDDEPKNTHSKKPIRKKTARKKTARKKPVSKKPAGEEPVAAIREESGGLLSALYGDED